MGSWSIRAVPIQLDMSGVAPNASPSGMTKRDRPAIRSDESDIGTCIRQKYRAELLVP
jgi:hypothetical protein